MKVLVVGSGGREHALCWSISRSPLCESLICAPGNAGVAEIAECVDVAAEDLDGLVRLARQREIDFVVVGPEAPLVAGLVDRLEAAGIAAFGPKKAAAAIEGSKIFMKELCERHGIATAPFARFDEPDQAKEYIRIHGAPIVVKADGLAAGKGVTVCRTEIEAFAAIDHILTEGAFGDAGSQVVIEAFLPGEEASFFCLVHGTQVLPLASAQDHKPAFDHDEGPNTGGMGAYSPAPALTPALTSQVMDRIIRPTVAALAAEGRPYSGLLYAGLMIDGDRVWLLEYNCRFGDPECQPLLMRLKSDLLAALVACHDGRLDEITLEWHAAAALTVVMASRGYPGYYQKGSEIRGLAAAAALPGVVVFHAGTKIEQGRTVANGGRVLGVTACGADVAAAQRRAYEAVAAIDWPQGFCRHDIGWRALQRQ